MLFLATFFPTSDDDDDLFYDKEIPFEAVTEFLKLTVDLADLVGIYFVMQRVAGKGQVKILTAGVGWAFADFLLTRVIFLWVGARGIEFDWKYMQKSFDANIDLVHFLTLACLVWLWMRREVSGFGNNTRSSGSSFFDTGMLSLAVDAPRSKWIWKQYAFLWKFIWIWHAATSIPSSHLTNSTMFIQNSSSRPHHQCLRTRSLDKLSSQSISYHYPGFNNIANLRWHYNCIRETLIP